MSGSQVAASVLASTSAAVVASFFGVAGTIIGAAVVSVVATVGTAAYGLGIRRTTDRLQRLQTERLGRTGRAGDVTGTQVRPTATATGAGLATAVGNERAPGAADGARPDAVPAALWGRLAHHRWSLAGAVVLVLALSLGAVSLLEVATDGPLSGGAGGGRTSIGAVLGRGESHSEVDGGSSGSTTTTVTDEGVPAPAADPGASTTTIAGAPSSGASGTSTTTSTTAPTTTTVPPTTSSTVAPAPEPPPTTVPPSP